MKQWPLYLSSIVLFLLLQACKDVKVCHDPSAVNYSPYLGNSRIADNRVCIYDMNNSLIGNWTYTDTFNYYPPTGGLPQTSYTQHSISIYTGGSSSVIYLSGFPFGQSYTGNVQGTSIVCNDITFNIQQNAPIVITFPDGLTNSAIGYLTKQ